MHQNQSETILLNTRENLYIPNHVAIIMDGNGRRAEQRGLARLEGHRAGVESLRLVMECFNEYQIKYVTVYAFSSENWSRPGDEVHVAYSAYWRKE